jgi:hypothetical protein
MSRIAYVAGMVWLRFSFFVIGAGCWHRVHSRWVFIFLIGRAEVAGFDS